MAGKLPPISQDSRPYQPYGAALELFRFGTPKSQHSGRAIVLAGPAGTGKSRACLEKLHACADKYDGMRGLILRQTRSSLTDTGLVTWEEHVLPKDSPVKKGSNRENRHSYKFRNGSEIVVGGLEDITRIMSSEYDLIYIQEAIEIAEDHFEMLLTRLRGRAMPYRAIIADTNPGSGTHWLKKREQEGKLVILETMHEDNPTYYDHVKNEWTPFGLEYLETLEGLTGHRLARMRYGQWVSAEGARWPQLDDRIHRFKMSAKFPFGISSSFNIIIGLDYGLRAPYCALWIAIDHDGDLYVFREDYRAGLTADVQASEVIKQTKNNERIKYVYADPRCWDMYPGHEGPSNNCTKDYYAKAFEEDSRFGPLLKGYNKSRQHNLDCIDSLLSRNNQYPNLYIEEGCVNLWRELCEAVWDTRGATPDKREDIDPSCHDHAITALYYACNTFIDVPKGESYFHVPSQVEQAQIRNTEAIERQRRKYVNEQRNRMRSGRRFY